MSLLNKLALSVLAAGLTVSPAFAADLITVPTSTPAEMPVYEEPGFDWDGFYAGVYGVGQNGSESGTQFGLGVQAGVNAQFDFYLLGAEVAVEGLIGDVGNATHGQILGRAGLVVTDDVLVYAAGGYGMHLGNTADSDVLLGGGVEVAVTENVSLEAQYLHSFPLSGDNAKDQVTFGANFHF